MKNIDYSYWIAYMYCVIIAADIHKSSSVYLIILLFCYRLVAKAGTPYLIHKIPRPKGSGFWLVAIQVLASFNLLLSIVVMFTDIFDSHTFLISLFFPWFNCYPLSCSSHYSFIFDHVGCGIYRWPLVFWGSEGGIGGNLAIYGLVSYYNMTIVSSILDWFLISFIN